MKLHMIAAVGRNGAIGLNGKLPWHNSDDLRLFKHITTNKAIIVGKRTAATLPPLPEREVIVWEGIFHPEAWLKNFEAETGYKEAWLCGGSYTYEAFAPYVNGNRVINFIDYDGPHNSKFPFAAYGLQGW
jgi:dihydrofolate reductase